MAKKSKRERKRQILSQYLPSVISSFNCYTYGNIPKDKFYNACHSYAGNIKYEDCFGLIDETVFGSAKKGMLFGADGFYSDSHHKIMLYKDGISYNSLPSYYNITAINEMLRKLYGIENEMTGWDIAGAIFGASIGLIQEFADSLDSLDTDSAKDNTPALALTDETNNIINEDNVDDEMIPLMKKTLEHIKRLQMYVNDALEEDSDDIVKAISEISETLSETIFIDENLIVSNEEFVDLTIARMLEQEDIEGIEIVNFEKATQKTMLILNDFLEEINIQTDVESEAMLRLSLEKYQKKLRQVRKVWKKLIELVESED